MAVATIDAAPVAEIIVEPDAFAITITGQDVTLTLAETQGPIGPAGNDISHPFPFAASLTWAIAHKLNRYPSVTIIDTAGEVLLASIAYVDSNNIVATFGAPTAGTAYLN